MKTKRIRFNKKLCSECRLCETVCALCHRGKINPSLSAIEISTNALTGENIRMSICRHCKKPKCKESCPEEAIYTNKNTGTVHINYERCNGCFDCINACPFNAMKENKELNGPIKCDLCGFDPQCVFFCPQQALKYD
jgi:anaerobic carbon-monoxide dehydrogenase iron sulfur subunit